VTYEEEGGYGHVWKYWDKKYKGCLIGWAYNKLTKY
jgi:hypothetical protein